MNLKTIFKYKVTWISNFHYTQREDGVFIRNIILSYDALVISIIPE